MLFEYNAHDHKLFVNDWYAGFGGTLHCDADPFFELLFESAQINPSYCHSHARRKFEPIANATKTGLAHQLDPYRYYVAILKAIPHCNTVQDYEALLPWNIGLPKVGEVRQAA